MTPEQVASKQECLRAALIELFQPFGSIGSVSQDECGEWVASYHEAGDDEPCTFTISRGDLDAHKTEVTHAG